MEKKQSKLAIITNGLLKENPNLRLVLGTCPTLAITTAVFNSIGMGLAATFVLIFSNMAISACRKIIPDKVPIRISITIIAGFVTIVMMLVQAFVQPLYQALGVYLPLIVVNCIILGRAEMFASKNGVLDSALDGLGMGLGFTLTLTLMGFVRELLGRWYPVRHPDPALQHRADGNPRQPSGRILRLWRSDGACQSSLMRSRQKGRRGSREDGLCRLPQQQELHGEGGCE